MEITVKSQREMTFRETLEFCTSSIRHRFSRSLLTLSVVILAVAFFMYLQCSNIFRSGIRENLKSEIQESRTGARLASLLFVPHTPGEFCRMIARCDDEMLFLLGNYFSWDKNMALKLRSIAIDISLTESCFNTLPTGKVQLFLKEGRGRTEIEKLCSLKPQHIIRRSRALGIKFPLTPAEVEAFVAGFPEYSKQMPAAVERWQIFQSRLRSLAGIRLSSSVGRDGRNWLLKLQGEKLETLNRFFAAEGFTPGPKRRDKMMIYLAEQQAREMAAAYLARPEVRQQWRGTFGAGSYTKLDEKLSILDSDSCRAFAGPLSDSQRSAVARATRERLKLNNLEAVFLPDGSDMLRDDRSRQFYLMTLAFLVCVIGITNAMLMSITERFTEIATLKCLGATDFFILIQIVLESLMQGLTGGAAGVILGLLTAAGSNLITAGGRLAGAWDWAALGEAALWSLAAGVILSILAAIYPAVKAARMAPMEAMRVQ